MKKKNQKGFTLIELITVMAIISILATLSFFALNRARDSARDTRRKADLEAISSALELYKADCSSYPSTIPAAGNQFTGTLCGLAANIYLEAIPGDPMPGRTYVYAPLDCNGDNCLRFRLWTALEVVENAPAVCTGIAPTCGDTGCNFCVANP